MSEDDYLKTQNNKKPPGILKSKEVSRAIESFFISLLLTNILWEKIHWKYMQYIFVFNLILISRYFDPRTNWVI